MRNTDGLQKVAVALMSDPRGEHYGYPLGKQTGLRSGVLYPILGRLLEAGWLEDSWEDTEVALGERRPPRRFYRLTDLGRRELGAIAVSSGDTRSVVPTPTPRFIRGLPPLGGVT